MRVWVHHFPIILVIKTDRTIPLTKLIIHSFGAADNTIRIMQYQESVDNVLKTVEDGL